ncbi:MAG: TonB-dependent receptor domain-containing protein, partial [Owenweeksia sp.]
SASTLSGLDIARVEVVRGSSSAVYGLGASSGVISFTTKNPFDYQGLSASVKVGERALTETAVRYAEAFKLFGSDFENLAFKINLFYLTANDWEATNYSPVDDSRVPADNPGGYDAVNIYGDEDLAGGNKFDNLANVLDFPSYAGLGVFYRNGYREENLVDYDTRNFKSGLGLYYRFARDIELSYNFNYGSGTTVYQGENRFSLKDISFYQNIVELRKKDHFYVKAYKTQENAGNSYDAVLTAFKMNEAIATNPEWNNAYKTLYRNNYRFGEQTLALAGGRPMGNAQEWYNTTYRDSLAVYNGLITSWHDSVRQGVNSFFFPRPEPGTAQFDSLFNHITSRTFAEGGSRFYDRSALYHIMGEYQFNPSWATIRVGGNFRLYRPDSRGNIFDEIDSTIIIEDSLGNEIDRQFIYRQISNSEYGIYAGAIKELFDERLKLSATLRMDKNENFDYLFSPALSTVYVINEFHTVRISFGKAIRNPTLQDQYLRYDVGRAILLGNLNGYDSLVTLQSFDNYRNTLNRDTLNYFNVNPIKPEEVLTLELGYRASLFKRVFLDV